MPAGLKFNEPGIEHAREKGVPAGRRRYSGGVPTRHHNVHNRYKHRIAADQESGRVNLAVELPIPRQDDRVLGRCLRPNRDPLPAMQASRQSEERDGQVPDGSHRLE